MKKYVYKAWDKDFNIISNIIEEDSIETAAQKLINDGLTIIKIKPKADKFETILGNKKLLKNEDLASFCGQVAIILQAGINLVKGLSVIEIQVKSKKLKSVLTQILSGVKKGKTLSLAMADTGAFPKLLTDMVASGELSGNIDEVLLNMEAFYQRESELRSKVKSAAAYPIVLICMLIGMLIFFNFMIYPDLKDLFKNMSLPLITKILLGTLDFLNNNFIGIVIVILALILALKYIKTRPGAANLLDYAALKLPVIGTIKFNFITCRFIRSMAIFIKSSVPILSVFDSIQNIMGNSYLSQKVAVMKMDVTNGKKIADAIESQELFDPLIVQMIRVGEETGKLDESLSKLTEIYDKKLETNITRLMALAEPVFILVIGIIIAIVIISMALPIMNMSNSIKTVN